MRRNAVAILHTSGDFVGDLVDGQQAVAVVISVQRIGESVTVGVDGIV